MNSSPCTFSMALWDSPLWTFWEKFHDALQGSMFLECAQADAAAAVLYLQPIMHRGAAYCTVKCMLCKLLTFDKLRVW